MKRILLKSLICPTCLPDEYGLHVDIIEEHDDDINTGILTCPHCRTAYPIESGIGLLTCNPTHTAVDNKYESDTVVSSYLWSHYADLLDDKQSSDAYNQWSAQMNPHAGISVDLGAAVGRFSFEMGARCDLAIGIDNSVAFIKSARELMINRRITVNLKEEGLLTKEMAIQLPGEWPSDHVEFIVADALKIPLRSQAVSSVASLNLIDKVQTPLQHLKEMNRIAGNDHAQFLLSDPFSWSKEAADEKDWLGGRMDGPFSGKGLDNIIRLLQDEAKGLAPAWSIEKSGSLWWKIRTHANHFELIRSHFIKASR